MKRYLILVLIAVLMTACGGGGGGNPSSGSSSSGNSSYGMTFSPASVAFTDNPGTSSSFTVTVTPSDPSEFAGATTVYALIVDSQGVLSPNVNIVSNGSNSYNATFSISPSIAQGDYAGNFQLNLCKDSLCQSPFPGSPWSLPFEIKVGTFDFPGGVAVDSAGDIYVADTQNNVIRKINSAGVMTTFAGAVGANNAGEIDGAGASARFKTPTGIAVDGSGNVYVSDASTETIRKITPAGVVTTLAGSPGAVGSANGVGTAARFWNPSGLSIDGQGNLYVADTWNNEIRKITPAGVVTTLAGTAPPCCGSIENGGWADGTGSAARFYHPGGVALDGAGNLYVADTANSAIRKITSNGMVTTLAGNPNNPVCTAGDGTGSAACFNSPQGVAVDGSGNVYVADTNNSTIRKISPSAVVTTLAGTAAIGWIDGVGSAAVFARPQALAVDRAGNVYIADTQNSVIRKITAGVVATPAITN